jgi:dephospho-CoA kinase
MKGLVLAIVGMSGTGKSEVTTFIVNKYRFKLIYFGGYILEEVKKRNLEINSRNERLVREELRANHGMDIVAKLSLADIMAEFDNEQNVIIDGLYSFSEYEFLKERFPKNLYTIAIHASKRNRYERLGQREIRPLTREEVDERDYYEIKKLEKCAPIVLADFHIANEGLISDLHEKVDSTLNNLA